MSGLAISLGLMLALAPVEQAPSPGATARPADHLPAGAVARLGTARFLNLGRVFALAFAPDGKTLVTGAWDGSLRLWDVATRKELRSFAGHEGAVHAVVFAPDGKTIASGGHDRTVRLWEAATGKLVRPFAAGQGPIAGVAFAPDGKVLGSSDAGQSLCLWDVVDGRLLHRRTRDPRRVKSEDAEWFLAFSPDLRATAYSGIEGTFPTNFRHVLRVRDTATDKLLRQFGGRRFGLEAVAFSPDSKVLAAGSAWFDAQKRIRFWHVPSGVELRPIAITPGEATSPAFSPDGRLLAAAGSDTIRIWELATRREWLRFRNPEPGKTCLAFSPDGRLLASGSLDVTALLWDVTGRAPYGRLDPEPASPEKRQALWADLQDPDVPRARRALWALVAAGKPSVAFLGERLHPVTCTIRPEAITRLVADLDSEQFSARTRAAQELEKLGELAAPALQQALERHPSLETRQRLARLLHKVVEERSTPPAEQLRALRAVEALEHIGTPEARSVLEGLAKGTPGAILTQEAKAALERVDRRATPASRSVGRP